MSSLSSDILVTPQDLYSQISNTSSTVPYNTGTPQLGVRAVAGDGREFRYVQAGGTALAIGTLQQSSAEIANHQNLTPTAATVAGATSITVTLGNTLATANQYLGGWVLVTTGAGAGYQYQIAGNPAAIASATLVLSLVDPIQVATNTSTTKIDLIANPYSGVIINPATASSAPVGVAIYPVTASYYGWVQTRGVSNVLADGAITVGTTLVASNGTAGAVEPFAGVQAIVGLAVTDIDTTQYGAVSLLLD